MPSGNFKLLTIIGISAITIFQAVFSMLEDMDFMRKFKIPKDQLAR